MMNDDQRLRDIDGGWFLDPNDDSDPLQPMRNDCDQGVNPMGCDQTEQRTGDMAQVHTEGTKVRVKGQAWNVLQIVRNARKCAARGKAIRRLVAEVERLLAESKKQWHYGCDNEGLPGCPGFVRCRMERDQGTMGYVIMFEDNEVADRLQLSDDLDAELFDDGWIELSSRCSGEFVTLRPAEAAALREWLTKKVEVRNV